mgnify:CR=1 FL=1
MIDEPLKPWQHGYDLEHLVKIQDNSFRVFNRQTLSPFLEMKKNRVAEALHNRELFLTYSGGIHYVGLKSGGLISMFTGYKVPILKKRAGDVLVRRFSPSERAEENDELAQHLNRLAAKANVFLFLLDECAKSKEIATKCGFEFKGYQYNTFSDIIAIFYKGTPRPLIKTDPAQYWTLVKSKVPSLDKFLEPIREVFARSEDSIPFTNHYSNYNVANAWSAISLRGYTDDWRFVAKPAEMNKKWKEENKGKPFWLQDTTLMPTFNNPAGGNFVGSLLDHLGLNDDPHRIRFMKLTPGNNLGRHTDQVCPDTGVEEGELRRIHFPLFTNEKVRFRCWENKDVHEVNMKFGECWYLDDRKPHEVINDGKTDRIHLVIDVPTNEKVRRLFK